MSRQGSPSRKRVRLGATLTLGLAALAASSVARAEDAPPPPTSEAPAAAAQDGTMAEARKQFQAGVNLLDDPDGAKYEEAYNAFKKAYQLSQSPKVLGNVAFCAMHLERDGEAVDAYTTYLRESPDISERERSQIQKDLATLSSTIARVRVVVKRPGARFILVDTRSQTHGSSVENTYAFEGTEATVRVRPGRHAFRIKDGAEESIVFETAVAPTSTVVHEFTFRPPRVDVLAAAPAARPPSIAGPVVMGVTGALVLGGGIASGLLARSATSSIEARCPNDVCPADYDLDSERSSARTFGTVADVAMIGGGALIGGSLLWYALQPRGRSGSRAAFAAPPRTAWKSSAMCTHAGCALQLQRGF
jgi:hypothetical protein